MSKVLRLADDLTLPADTAAVQKYGLIGRSGSGKTYCAGKIVELLIDAGAQVVIVDPVGTHWGLRLAANGKDPGIAIPIIGGEHRDVPLEPTGGALLADVIVDKRTSAVLDVSQLTGGELRRFVADFATHLLQRKKSARSPILLVWEECQEFVPQKVFHDAARMVGAMERLIKIGRNFGIGTMLITQRPQAVAKDVLNQTEVLFVYQTTGPHERKVVEGWVVEHGLDLKRVVDELPSLRQGVGYLWSPQWLRLFQKVRVLPKWTFDASATPTFDAKPANQLAPIDLKQIETAMAATIERAKADDPKELRAELAKVRRELAIAQKVTPPAAEPVKVPVLEGEELERAEVLVERLETLAGALMGEAGKLVNAADVIADAGKELRGEAASIKAAIATTSAPPRATASSPARPASAAPASLSRRGGAAQAAAVSRNGASGSSLTGPEQRIVDAIAWMESIGVAEPEQTAVAFLAGYTYGGGGFNNPRGALRTDGLVEYLTGDRICLTDAGRALAHPPDTALTTAELHERILGRLPGPEQRVLQPLLARGKPFTMSNEDLAGAAGYTVGSGGFNNPRGRLRTLGLVEYPSPGFVAARSILFLD